MQGKYLIQVEDARLCYEFILERKVTILTGLSAIGKTQLFQMVREYGEDEEQHNGIQISVKYYKEGEFLPSDVRLSDLDHRHWREDLEHSEECIYLVDEGVSFTKKLAPSVKCMKSYLLIITREEFGDPTYDIKSIMTLKSFPMADGRTLNRGIVDEATSPSQKSVHQFLHYSRD